MRRPLLLVAGCAWIWLLLAPVAYVLDPEWGLVHSAVAAAICLLPTVATLLWCDRVLGNSPEMQLAAVFGGTGVRMAVVVGAALALYSSLEEFRLGRFWVWIVVFYLVSLTLEMILL